MLLFPKKQAEEENAVDPKLNPTSSRIIQKSIIGEAHGNGSYIVFTKGSGREYYQGQRMYCPKTKCTTQEPTWNM